MFASWCEKLKSAPKNNRDVLVFSGSLALDHCFLVISVVLMVMSSKRHYISTSPNLLCYCSDELCTCA